MNQEAILSLLRTVVHPEMGSNIVENGIVEEILLDGEKLRLTLNFPKARDPFALSIKRQVDTLIRENYPSLTNINILIKEQAPKTPAPKTVPTGRIAAVDHIIAIASGKGGVGKSTVAANLAVTLARMGYRVGLLDADIYGPSLPRMFGVDGYTPAAAESDGKEFIVPAESLGVKLMSIGFFIRPSDALVWRGPMATNALRQLICDTQWGALDFLLIDLPPGTGDVHLSIVQELKLDGAIVVSTPQQVALADVRRGVEMFRTQGIDVPVLGLIENMAWFTPAELPGNRYYLFGKEGAKRFAEEEKIPFLGQIPIVQSVMEGGEEGIPAVNRHEEVGKRYREAAEKLVENLSGGCQ